MESDLPSSRPAYLDKKSLATHVVATNITPAKRREYEGLKVVTPSWIEVSVNARRLLRWQDFKLPEGAEESVRIGAGDEEAIPTGSLAPQLKLDKFVGKGWKGKGKEVVREGGAPNSVEVNRRPKDSTESMDALSELGIRLTEAAKSSSKTSPSSFFPSRSTSANNSPTKPHVPLATTSTSHYPTKRSEKSSALMNDPDWLSKHTALSPDFLPGYIAKSRLGHLSAWKNEFSEWVADLQVDRPHPTRKKPLSGGPEDATFRTIFHVDFDCFFVAAGLISRPHLRGKPVAVCHGGAEGGASTSEISSCSYEARSFGVRAGMP